MNDLRKYILEAGDFGSNLDSINKIITLGSDISNLISRVAGWGGSLNTYLNTASRKRKLNNSSVKAAALVSAIKARDKRNISKLEMSIVRDLQKIDTPLKRLYAAEFLLSALEQKASEQDIKSSFKRVFGNIRVYYDVKDVYQVRRNYRRLMDIINDSREDWETEKRDPSPWDEPEPSSFGRPSPYGYSQDVSDTPFYANKNVIRNYILESRPRYRYTAYQSEFEEDKMREKYARNPKLQKFLKHNKQAINKDDLTVKFPTLRQEGIPRLGYIIIRYWNSKTDTPAISYNRVKDIQKDYLRTLKGKTTTTDLWRMGPTASGAITNVSDIVDTLDSVVKVGSTIESIITTVMGWHSRFKKYLEKRKQQKTLSNITSYGEALAAAYLQEDENRIQKISHLILTNPSIQGMPPVTRVMAAEMVLAFDGGGLGPEQIDDAMSRSFKHPHHKLIRDIVNMSGDAYLLRETVEENLKRFGRNFNKYAKMFNLKSGKSKMLPKLPGKKSFLDKILK